MTTVAREEAGREELEMVPLRRPWSVLFGVVAVLLCALVCYSVSTNPRFRWGIVRHYLFSADILLGLWRTILLTVAGMGIGVALGVVIAVMTMSSNRVLRNAAGGYVLFFRGTPLLVQLIFWYNLSAVYPVIGFGSWQFSYNDVIGIWGASIIALGLNEAAYMSEIVRSGILSVSSGQREAAAALGMSGSLTFRRIIWPQALRVIVPPTGNQVIGMLKYTSLVSVIALPELLYSAQIIYADNYQTIPLLIVASLWYFAVSTVLTILQHRLEVHFGRGFARTPVPGVGKANRR
jgi:polar amino acid transport system permease protein